MKNIERLKELMLDSLADFDSLKNGGKELKMGEIDALQKVTDTIKNCYKICMLDEEMGGHSQRGYSGRHYSRDGEWSADMHGSYGRGSSYDDSSYSGSHRGMHYVRGHYSRADARDEMMSHLDHAMSAASDPHEREAIDRVMRDLNR